MRCPPTREPMLRASSACVPLAIVALSLAAEGPRNADSIVAKVVLHLRAVLSICTVHCGPTSRLVSFPSKMRTTLWEV
jgi:hypothetical protein